MAQDDSQNRERSDLFSTTHWSLVIAVQGTDSIPAGKALASLCETYWYPLYVFVRSRGYHSHDAEDLTQSFFENLLEKNSLALVARDKGRFRAFLLASINPTYVGLGPTAEYHPEVDWLKRNNRLPEMGKAIEITNVAIFPFENRRMPYVLLHELTHAYHDQILGFDQPEILAAFKRARDSGSYDKVKRFNGKSTVMDKAYAMSNAKEYFAEVTEAYFGQNDFYPFNREELKAHDPLALQVVEKVWGVQTQKDEVK